MTENLREELSKLPESIETLNLLLKLIDEKYATDIFKEFTSEITTFMAPRPASDISETLDFIRVSIAKNKAGSDLQLVITNKQTGDFIGCVGLHHINTDTPELGIWIKKSAFGHGYGKEAVTALKIWADANLKYKYLIYPVADKNISSRKIPESLGGIIEKEEDSVTGEGNPMHTLEYRIYPKLIDIA